MCGVKLKEYTADHMKSMEIVNGSGKYEFFYGSVIYKLKNNDSVKFPPRSPVIKMSYEAFDVFFMEELVQIDWTIKTRSEWEKLKRKDAMHALGDHMHREFMIYQKEIVGISKEYWNILKKHGKHC